MKVGSTRVPGKSEVKVKMEEVAEEVSLTESWETTTDGDGANTYLFQNSHSEMKTLTGNCCSVVSQISQSTMQFLKILAAS